MKVYTYRYKVSGATWGLYMEMDCKITPFAEFGGHAFSMNGLIYLGLPLEWVKANSDNQAVNKQDAIDFMLFALAKLLPELSKHISTPTVIEVVYADILPSDFHEEVFGYALVGWLCREFDLKFQLPSMIYDKNANKYLRP